jgi:hypothetical protein
VKPIDSKTKIFRVSRMEGRSVRSTERSEARKGAAALAATPKDSTWLNLKTQVLWLSKILARCPKKIFRPKFDEIKKLGPFWCKKNGDILKYWKIKNPVFGL